MALLTVKDLSIGYDGQVILSGLNFAVNAGDYLCIVGENGAGKTTLMRTLLHLQEPLGGEILTGDGLAAGEIGSLKRICDDTEILNMYPYPFPKTALAGDVNCDGEVTLKDAILLAKVIGEVSGTEITTEGFDNADVNDDGYIRAGDLTLLLKMLAGMNE